MNKDTYVISFMGPSTIGKSRIISTCIEDDDIAAYMHKDNVNGKTKSNVVYVINADKENSLRLVAKTREICTRFVLRNKDNMQFQANEFKKVFSPISQVEDFEGIEEFVDSINNIDELKDWVNQYLKKIQDRIYRLSNIDNAKNTKESILFCYEYFEQNLIYNELFDIEIELKASTKFRTTLDKYGLNRMILIDTRGVFDAPDKLQRSFTNYMPDVNIFIFEEKGMTEHLFNQIYKELKPMFGKSFEICIRTRTHLDAPILTVDNCINPICNESLAKKFDSTVKFLENQNVLEGNTVFDIRLREQLGSVLPEIPNKDDYDLTQEQIDTYNDKYDDIVCRLFDKVIGLKQQEEVAIATIQKKCKDSTYKKVLIDSIIYGKQNLIWSKYARRCEDAVNGDGGHLTPRPQWATIKRHIEDLFFNNKFTDWGREEYICNIVTYEAANLLNQAVNEIRKNREQFSDEELSEYLFILKNTLAACQNSLSQWKSYVYFSDSGYSKNRIPSKYYYKACKETVDFSKGGTIYYTVYDNINATSSTKCHKSALLNCIIQAVSELLAEKLDIEKIILEEIETAKQSVN